MSLNQSLTKDLKQEFGTNFCSETSFDFNVITEYELQENKRNCELWLQTITLERKELFNDFSTSLAIKNNVNNSLDYISYTRKIPDNLELYDETSSLACSSPGNHVDLNLNLENHSTISHIYNELHSPNPPPWLIPGMRQRAKNWQSHETNALIAIMNENNITLEMGLGSLRYYVGFWKKVSISMSIKGHARTATMCKNRWKSLIDQLQLRRNRKKN